jgi:hypothetical protein
MDPYSIILCLIMFIGMPLVMVFPGIIDPGLKEMKEVLLVLLLLHLLGQLYYQ